MTIAARVSAGILAAFYIAPWLWLVGLGALVAAAQVQYGHPPSYSNPDPKRVAGFAYVYLADVLMIIPVMVSPVVVGLEILARALGRRSLRRRALPLAAYLVGLGLAGAVIVGDAFGLMNWLMD